MMNIIFKVFFLLLLLSSSFLFASSFKIYASKNIAIDSLSKSQISKLYLKKISKINGIKVIVYDTKEYYDEFTKYFLNKTPSQIHAYWMKQIFLGKRVPPIKLNENEVNQKLLSSPNVIIYSSQKLNGKVLYEKE